MNAVNQKADALAQAKVRQTKAAVKEMLTDQTPDHISVTETGDSLVVSGRLLGKDLLGNSSLRDVAFLMRGVR